MEARRTTRRAAMARRASEPAAVTVREAVGAAAAATRVVAAVAVHVSVKRAESARPYRALPALQLVPAPRGPRGLALATRMVRARPATARRQHDRRGAVVPPAR